LSTHIERSKDDTNGVVDDWTYRRLLGHYSFRVARAATEATLRTAVLGTRAGFSVARGCCAVTGRAVEGAVHSLPLPLPGRAHVSSLVHSTHRRVQRALCATEHCTLTGMKFSGLALESCLKYLTGKQVLEDGTELSGIVESILEFYKLASFVTLDLRGISLLEMTRALYAIACLQRVFGPLSVPCPAGEDGEHTEGLVEGLVDLDTDASDSSSEELESGRRSAETATSSAGSAASRPSAWQMEEMHVMTKYSIASYGRLFLSMWDKKPQLLGLSEEEVIAKYTGGEPDWVLHREEATLFRPAHFVAMDHEFRLVVVAVRGTLGVSDTLCDVACTGVALELPDGAAGEAHAGFLRAARALDDLLRPVVRRALLLAPGYQLRLCGHSMGAGVAALLAGLWRKDYPTLHCYGFGPACATTLSLSRSLASHITSVVLGNDFVTRLSLGTITDLRNAVVTLCRDAEPGLLDRITAEAVEVIRHRHRVRSAAPAPAAPSCARAQPVAAPSCAHDASIEMEGDERPGNVDASIGCSNKSDVQDIDIHSSPKSVAASECCATSTDQANDRGEHDSDITASLLFLESVVNALRASMQSVKMVPAGAVYHLHTLGAKTAPPERSARGGKTSRSRTNSACHTPCSRDRDVECQAIPFSQQPSLLHRTTLGLSQSVSALPVEETLCSAKPGRRGNGERGVVLNSVQAKEKTCLGSGDVVGDHSCMRIPRMSTSQSIPCLPVIAPHVEERTSKEAEATLGQMRRVNAACFGELLLSRTMVLTHSPHTYERAIRAHFGGSEWTPNILHRLVLHLRSNP